MMNANMGMKINNSEKNMGYIPQGWECPKCGAVMAPWQNGCVNCIGKKQNCTPSYTFTTYRSSDIPVCINSSSNANEQSLKNALNSNLEKFDQLVDKSIKF